MTDRAVLYDLYRRMLRIRLVEEAIAREYPNQEMRCPVHLSIGQEAPAAAFSLVAEAGDLAVSTHRGHAHYLAKGGDLGRMIAEIYGKATGCSGGIGGSMHLIDVGAGFMGTSAIVGNSIPVGVGLGLALKLKGSPQAACVFLGDGATEEGVFYESLNIAALRELPVLFLCENNQYSVYTPLEQRQAPGRRIVDVARSLGVRAEAVNGHSAQACFEVLSRELPAVRRGEGPTLIEFSTHRYLEHCGPSDDEHLGYRKPGELQEWLDRDPIETLVPGLGLSDEEVLRVREVLEFEIAEAFAFAKASPFPDPSALSGALYA
jgi:TPP-dependent pyruvate/acetoin dehydrogenase alpha subunit